MLSHIALSPFVRLPTARTWFSQIVNIILKLSCWPRAWNSAHCSVLCLKPTMRGIVTVGLNERTPANSSGPSKLNLRSLHGPLREKRPNLAESIKERAAHAKEGQPHARWLGIAA